MLIFNGDEFAKALYTKRVAERETKLSLQEVGTALGVSGTHVSRLESGIGEPSAAVYANACAWLGVAMETFFTS